MYLFLWSKSSHSSIEGTLLNWNPRENRLEAIASIPDGSFLTLFLHVIYVVTIQLSFLLTYLEYSKMMQKHSEKCQHTSQYEITLPSQNYLITAWFQNIRPTYFLGLWSYDIVLGCFSVIYPSQKYGWNSQNSIIAVRFFTSTLFKYSLPEGCCYRFVSQLFLEFVCIVCFEWRN